MKCDANFFFNENVGSCFQCSAICDNLVGTGNSKQNCLKHCPDYFRTESGGTVNAPYNNNLEIILPSISILVFSIIIAAFFIIRHRKTQERKRRQRNFPVDTPPPPIKYTEEEVGDDGYEVGLLKSLRDSGIDTTKVDLSAVERESRPTHSETQTGLSEMTANNRYLKNASDASGAQETLV